MADWIWYGANEKNIKDIEIDIINECVKPSVLQIKPIIGHLHQLRKTIQSTLESQGFPNDFITEAKFVIHISQPHKILRQLTCHCIVIDKEERKYSGKVYTEKALENPYRVYALSVIERIKRFVGW